MSHKILTVSAIQNEKPRSAGRHDVHDLRVPGLALRVSARNKTFVFIGRLPGSKNPSRWTISAFPDHAPVEVREKALADARETAQIWSYQVKQGINPQEEAKRVATQIELGRRLTFGSALQDWMATLWFRKRNRHVPEDIRLIKREFLVAERNPLVDTPISEISDEDIASLISTIRDRPARVTAIACFKHLRQFFRWARAAGQRRHYGLTANPMADLELADLLLTTNERQRYFKVPEIRAFWLAVQKLGYPIGPYCKMLLLTGQRKSDVAGARWSEIDLAQRIWIIPQTRYKTGVEQVVPLSLPLVEILAELRSERTNNHGDYIFSHTNGMTRMNGFSTAVSNLRKLMLAEYQAENPHAKIEHWVLHDQRRTIKTQLSRMQVPPHVSEAILGHGKRGIEKVYNQYSYLPQMRIALELWAEFLLSVIDQPNMSMTFGIPEGARGSLTYLAAPGPSIQSDLDRT